MEKKRVGNRRLLHILVCMLTVCFCLSGCQEGAKEPMTQAETLWAEARETGDFDVYLKGARRTVDMEELRREAAGGDYTLSQQFKAVVILCNLECMELLSEDTVFDNIDAGDSVSRGTEEKAAMFRYAYPESAACAEGFLAKVNTEPEAFWAAVEESIYYPYDYLMPFVAAVGRLDEETLVHLMSGLPEKEVYATTMRDALNKWVDAHPLQTISICDALEQSGYYEGWRYYDWTAAYLYTSRYPYRITAQTPEEALAYVTNVRDGFLDGLESKFPDQVNLSRKSALTEADYYDTDLTVTIENGLLLKDSEELPETIELEGKKVMAFYRNLCPEKDFPMAPPPFRLLGDFMLGLPKEEYPRTMEEADYYLVLTPAYEYIGYYQDESGGDSDILEVYSSTSVDLYEAETGRLLRHVGNVPEEADYQIITSYYRNAPRYPGLTKADVLSFLYHHINEPESYAAMLDNTGGQIGYERDEAVTLGSFEITYHSGQTVEQYGSRKPGDGCLFLQAEFTVTNIGAEKATFLPLSGDMLLELADLAGESYYSCVDTIWGEREYLFGKVLSPGETVEGNLVFEVPERVTQNMEALYFVLTLGRQMAVYPVE